MFDTRTRLFFFLSKRCNKKIGSGAALKVAAPALQHCILPSVAEPEPVGAGAGVKM